jgi:hypothetical protein
VRKKTAEIINFTFFTDWFEPENPRPFKQSLFEKILTESEVWLETLIESIVALGVEGALADTDSKVAGLNQQYHDGPA